MLLVTLNYFGKDYYQDWTGLWTGLDSELESGLSTCTIFSLAYIAKLPFFFCVGRPFPAPTQKKKVVCLCETTLHSILKYSNKATSIYFKASVKDYECACCNAFIMGATEKA